MAESHAFVLTPNIRDGSAADRAHVDALVRRSGSSFFWGMRALPPHKREACYAIYAFCREVDDIADGTESVEQKRAALAQWRAEIERLYSGAPSRPVTRVLHEAVRAFDLDRDAFLAIIDGMEMDANGPIRAPSQEELRLYCARVAGAVGRLCVRVFGIGNPQGRALAEELGRALQLTNILRDLAEDASLGRLYLPRELLEANGIATREPDAVLAHPRLPRVCAALGEEAEAGFDEAARIMATLDVEAVRPARMMMDVYRRLLSRMAAQQFNGAGAPRGLFERVRSKAEKLAIALRHALF